MQDYGYDVADYRKVHHEFGTNDDLILLITEMHKRGMKLMMDFVPNHTRKPYKNIKTVVTYSMPE